MRRLRWIVVVCVVVLLGASLGLSGAGADEPVDAHDALLQVDLDEDSIEMAATVDTDGDADWRVAYRFDLEDEDTTQAFEELQADVEENESAYLDPFEDRIQRTADTAAETTEREMEVRAFGVSTDRQTQPDAEFGAVVFSFEWAGFAVVDDGTVEAGDAIEGLFLDEGTSLTLRWAEPFTLEEAQPTADTTTDQRLTWRGPREFDAGEPRAQLSGDGIGGVGEVSLISIVLVVFVVALGIAAAYATRRMSRTEATVDAEPEETNAQEPPSELLSNEERVLTLVEENGGRIKQKEVAETLDWSAAMTSQVVGNLREEGAIETFRIGRENVLTLPDVDIVPDQDDEET